MEQNFVKQLWLKPVINLFELIIVKKINATLKCFIILFFLLKLNTLIAQDFKKQIQTLKSYQLKSLDFSNLTKHEKAYLKSQKKLILYSELDTISFKKDDKKNSSRNTIIKNLIKGDFFLFKKIPEDSVSLNFYKKALLLSLEIKDSLLITQSYRKIIQQLSQNRTTYKITKNYLNDYKKYLYDEEELGNYLFFKNITEASLKNKETISSLKNGLKIAEKTNNNYLKAKYNQMIGVFFSYFRKENDSALTYMYKAKALLESEPYQLFKNELFGVYGNIGQYEDKKGNYYKAKKYYEKANNIQVPKYRYLVKVKLNEILAKNANNRNLKDSAYFYLQQSNLYKDTLNEFNKARALIDLDKKYQTEKKEKHILSLEKENLKTEAKNKQQKNLIIGSILFIIFGGTIATLSLKNSKRKRKLAEQEKKLESQKNLTLLKEQEINTINAMVEGQEKERKRVAEDLHDNLGSVLATLKLHFENLQINNKKKKINQEELFNKTENLIDEAYLKVRSIAHAKNAGVIANQGLLNAIQLMAEKISSADKIQIEVIHYGLDKALENSLEITIFRIVQELVTNIIKHANAKNATINISSFDNHLNIIVEDDGDGFDVKKINLKNGMGISSIKTRVEHLNGTFKVDATIGKGSSIILDIPIS